MAKTKKIPNEELLKIVSEMIKMQNTRINSIEKEVKKMNTRQALDKKSEPKIDNVQVVNLNIVTQGMPPSEADKVKIINELSELFKKYNIISVKRL